MERRIEARYWKVETTVEAIRGIGDVTQDNLYMTELHTTGGRFELYA
jgi:hypothetical protein